MNKKLFDTILYASIAISIVVFFTGCATWDQVSCYENDGPPSFHHDEVRVISKNKMLDRKGQLHTVRGMCLHDNPGFWNRVSFGAFDQLDRGQ